MFNLETSFDAFLTRKRLRLSIYLFVFCYLLVFESVSERVLSQSSSQAVIDNQKLLSARQLLIEGTEYLHKNQNEQARAKLESACEIAPDLPQAHHQLGIVLAKLGENEAAINEFFTAVSLDPNSAASWLNLAAVYQTSGNIEQAKATYQTFVDRFPQDKDISRIRTLMVSLENSDYASIKANVPDKSLHDDQSGDYYDEISRRGIWLWPQNRLPVKIYIEHASSYNGASTRFISILKDAFSEWAAASGGLLSFNFVDAPNKADIICSWSKDRRKFKNSSEAGNSRVYAKNGMLDKGEIEILTVNVNEESPISDNQARATTLHEVGHILGLTGHSDDAKDVMYMSASLKNTWLKLSSRDINTLVRLYSSTKPAYSKSQ